MSSASRQTLLGALFINHFADHAAWKSKAFRLPCIFHQKFGLDLFKYILGVHGVLVGLLFNFFFKYISGVVPQSSILPLCLAILWRMPKAASFKKISR